MPGLPERKEFQGFTLKRTINVSTVGEGVRHLSEMDSPLKISQLIEEHEGLLDEKVKAIPRANPILPKVMVNEVKQPPSCPLKDIQFVQLERFKKFKEQSQ